MRARRRVPQRTGAVLAREGERAPAFFEVHVGVVESNRTFGLGDGSRSAPSAIPYPRSRVRDAASPLGPARSTHCTSSKLIPSGPSKSREAPAEVVHLIAQHGHPVGHQVGGHCLDVVDAKGEAGCSRVFTRFVGCCTAGRLAGFGSNSSNWISKRGIRSPRSARVMCFAFMSAVPMLSSGDAPINRRHAFLSEARQRERTQSHSQRPRHRDGPVVWVAKLRRPPESLADFARSLPTPLRVHSLAPRAAPVETAPARCGRGLSPGFRCRKGGDLRAAAGDPRRGTSPPRPMMSEAQIARASMAISGPTACEDQVGCESNETVWTAIAS